ncbi:MAG: ester cyclase [Acidimicrobiales bacterium]
MADKREILQRLFDEIINMGDIDAADELFAEDFVDHGPTGVIHGREAFKGVVTAWRSAVPDVHCTIDNVIIDGDMGAWLVYTTGTHTGDALGFPATGKSFETVSANIGRFEGDRAAEHWSEQGMLPMLMQIGILQLPGA